MVADQASGTGAERPVMPGEMTRHTTDDGAFQTSGGIRVTRKTRRREKQGCRTYNRLHQTHPSSTLTSGT